VDKFAISTNILLFCVLNKKQMPRYFLLILLASFLSNSSFAQNSPDSLSAGSGADAPKAAGLNVRPVTVSFTLSPGQSATKEITVTNNMSFAKSFKIHFEDWSRDSLGDHVYQHVGSFPHSCARWTTTDKTAFTLEPGKSEKIRVNMSIPDSANIVNEMKWTMMFIGSVREHSFGPLAANKVRTGVEQQFTIGVHVYETPPAVTAASVKLLGFSKVKDKDKDGNEKDKVGFYRIICQNTGATQLSANAYIELTRITGAKDDKKIKIGPKSFPLFPGQRRIADLEIPKDLPKGKYIAVAAVDCGADIPLEAAQGIIDIK
jgi:hypothetical protein